MVYFTLPTSTGGVNLPSAHSTKMFDTKKSITMPFSEVIKHDLNQTVNEAVSYSALYFLINQFQLEKYIFKPSDSAFMDALKSAGIVVSMNEALRLAKRMGWSVQILK